MIFQLPYFAQVAIIRQMKPHECFFLGSLSKKAKRLVQRSIKKTFNGVVIDLNCKQIEVSNNSNTNRESGKVIAAWSKCDRKIITTTNFRENKWIKLEYNGIEMKCRLTFEKDCYVSYNLPTVWCDSRQIKLVPLALRQSISDVFGISNIIQVRMDFSSEGFTDIPSITQIDHIYEGFCTHEVDGKLLDRFLRRVEVKHSLHFINSLRFQSDSPIFSVDHLTIDKARHVSRESFLNFNGKSALLQNTSLKSEDLIEFVKKWLNGNNTKLESMVVVGNFLNVVYAFDREKVLEQFETMPWNPKRRDGRFKYPENSQTLYYSKDLLDCTQQVDIQREHDGLLATVVVTNEDFCFFVWHTPFAPPGTELPVTVLDEDDQSVSYALGSIAF
ncbi:unnamed protein product [Caenorhabditis brenneri]